jgi:DNA-binding NarL/FixJ family response regulator
MAVEHIDNPTHGGWTDAAPDAPPDLLSPDDLAIFRERLALLTPTQRRVLRARVAGQSIPEIAYVHDIAGHTVKQHLCYGLRVLGLNAGNPYGRVPRAAYLLGRVEGEQRG